MVSGSTPPTDSMIVVRIFISLFLMAVAICLGGMSLTMWEFALFPQGEVMKQLQWTSGLMALLCSGITVAVGLASMGVLFARIPR